MKLPRQSALLVILGLALAGCGQKGPLYLPGDASAVRTNIPTSDASTAPESDEDEDDAEKKSNPPR